MQEGSKGEFKRWIDQDVTERHSGEPFRTLLTALDSEETIRFQRVPWWGDRTASASELRTDSFLCVYA